MTKRIENFDEYQNIIGQFNNYHFAQSSVFYKARIENEVDFEAYSYYEGDKLIGCAQVLVKKIILGKKMLLIPFGPVTVSGISKDQILRFIQEISKFYSDIVYIQVNPLQSGLILDNGFEKSFDQYRHADGTLSIVLNKAPSDLFIDFRKDVKANIKKIEKENHLQFNISRTIEEYDVFWEMYENTQQKKGFKDSRKNLYKSFLLNNNAFVVSAIYEKKNVASVYCIEYKEQNTLITFLSSTTELGNKLKAPTFLRWKLLNYAFENKYKYFDFFSIEKELNGPSAFKLGFRGELVWFNPSYDYVINGFIYNLYKLIKLIKK